jgi:hypothetical protein
MTQADGLLDQNDLTYPGRRFALPRAGIMQAVGLRPRVLRPR